MQLGAVPSLLPEGISLQLPPAAPFVRSSPLGSSRAGMDSSRPFPPSPAFSDSDSLAGIDDLDAFLDAKGALSRWPTPPSRREIEEDLEVPSEESDYDSEDGVDGAAFCY